jgi:predicted Fe-S protein YdhL (DUF1289 family)
MISPCRKLCRLDSAGRTCMDCGRTVAEIARWAGMSDGERAAIMADLPARLEKQALERRRAAQQQQQQ